MGTVELKSNLHKLIDNIQSEQVLRTLYDFLNVRENNPGELWQSLSEEQKQEVLLAYSESEEEDYLIDKEKVFNVLNENFPCQTCGEKLPIHYIDFF